MAPNTPLVALAARPLFEPIAGWLRAFGGEAPPAATALNAALDLLPSRHLLRFLSLGGFQLGLWVVRHFVIKGEQD